MQFLFADYTLDIDRRELRCGSSPVAVEPQVFDLLIYLVENRDRVVSKDDLIEAVWGGRIVSDSTIASRINAARKALGDSGQAQTLIRTIPRKGLRFVGDVRTDQKGGAPAGAADSMRNGQEPFHAAGRPPARPALHEAQFCMTSDGTRIAFSKVGNGPPLVWAAHWLSHLAFTWESPVWRHWTEEFAKDHSFVRYDERGNGLSDWNDSEFSVEAFVRDLEAVVDALRLDRFALIGSARGGPTAITYAARHPDRISHLVLVNAFAQGWRLRGSAAEIEQREAMITLMQQRWTQDNPVSRQILTSLLLPDATTEEMGWFNDMQRISTSAENAARLFRSVGDLDVVDLLQDIAAPTLVLHCRDDAVIPLEQGQLIASRISGARLVQLESRNHILLPRDPAWAAFVSEARRFLREDAHLVPDRDRALSTHELASEARGGRIIPASTLTIDGVTAGSVGLRQPSARTFVVRTERDDGKPAPLADPAPNGSQAPLRPAALPPPDRAAIAVLPFINMSDEPEQEYFSDGISEDLITALSRLRWFFVISRNSSFSYKGKSVHLKQIAAELGVGYIVEGSVRKSGDCVRITAQLSDVATGSQIWAERYDRRLAGVFAVQDEITDAIVAAIEPQVYAAEHFRSARKPPECLAAWDLVMRALSHFWRVTRDDNVAAQALLEKAIALIPDYAQANAVLAVSHTFGAQMGWEDRAIAAPVAERTALAAFRADAEDPWAHLALATANVYMGLIDDALAAFESALRLNPNFSLALGYYGLVLTWVGRLKEGGDAARRALQLSPRDPFAAVYNGIIAYNEFVGRNYDEAMRAARESIRQRSDFLGGLRAFIAAAAMKGEVEVAKAALKDLRRMHPNVSLAWLGSQLPYAQASEREREHFLEAFRRAGLE